MYEDMYSSHDEPRRGSSSRRFSFPNSPLGGGESGGPSLTKHLQQLCLQNRLVQGSGAGDVTSQAGDTKIKVRKKYVFGFEKLPLLKAKRLKLNNTIKVGRYFFYFSLMP